MDTFSWAQRHGRQRRDVHSGDVDGVDYRWKIKLPGKGHASPVVWGDKVFVQSADPDNATQYVLCVQADSGKTLWQQEYASAVHPLNPRNSFASSTPAVDEQRLYVAWATLDHLMLCAINHEGHEVWHQDLGPYVCEHGFANSPMVYEDLVILVNSQQAEELAPNQQAGTSSVMAFERETGKLRRETPRTAARLLLDAVHLSTPGGTARVDLLRHGAWVLQSQSCARARELVVPGLHDVHGGFADHRR